MNKGALLRKIVWQTQTPYTPYDSCSKRDKSSRAEPVSTAEREDRSLVPNWMTTNFSTIPKSCRITLEIVLPPMPCHLMQRSPSVCKFLANTSLKFWRRKTSRRRMKEWPRIKIRSGAIMSKEKKKKKQIENNEYLPEKLKRSAQKFFWGSVQSDGERKKENYLGGTLFHILGMSPT